MIDQFLLQNFKDVIQLDYDHCCFWWKASPHSYCYPVRECCFTLFWNFSYLWFYQFGYDFPTYGLICIFLLRFCWASWFCNHVYHQIRGISSHYFLKCFFFFHSLSSPSKTQITYVLDHLILSNWSFLQFFFSLVRLDNFSSIFKSTGYFTISTLLCTPLQGNFYFRYCAFEF